MNRDDNYSERNDRKRGHSDSRQRRHSRKLTEDEIIRRRNDRRRELDAKIKRENDRKRYQDDRRIEDSYSGDFVGQELVDKIKNKITGRSQEKSSKSKSSNSNLHKNNNYCNNYDENDNPSTISNIFQNIGSTFKKARKGKKSVRSIRKKVFKGIGIALLLILAINIFSVIRLFSNIKNTVGTEAVTPGLLNLVIYLYLVWI